MGKATPPVRVLSWCLRALAVLMLVGPAARAAETRAVQSNAAPAAPALGAISGVVLEAASEEPVAGVAVTISGRSADGQSVRQQGMTDSRGRFVFRDLPASAYAYQITARKPGYVANLLAGTRRSGAPVALTSGQWRSDVRVWLHRNGSISGRVTDERGQPMTDVPVRARSRVRVGSRLQYALGPRVTTDDRGVYRIANLPPGDYIVLANPDSASELDVEPNPLIDRTTRGTYAAAFYPGVREVAAAVPVTIAASEHRPAVDFVLEFVAVGAIEGRLEGSTQGLGGTWLRLIQSRSVDMGFSYETAVAAVKVDGTFMFPAVPAGQYVIESAPGQTEVRLGGFGSDAGPIASPNSALYGHRPGGGITLDSTTGDVAVTYTRRAEGGWIRFPVQVIAGRTESVVIPVRPAVSISGRVVLDDAASAAAGAVSVPLSFFFAEPADLTLGLVGASADRNRPDVLEIRGLLPGEYYLTSRSGRHVVKSIVWNGRDYTDAPFDTSTGYDIDGVVVTMTSRGSTIAGTVRDAGGSPVPSATLIVFPADQKLWQAYGLLARRLGTVAADEAGRFTISALHPLTPLPGGDYLLAAVREAPSDWSDQAFLSAAARVATKVSVDWGDTRRVDLQLQEVVVR